MIYIILSLLLIIIVGKICNSSRKSTLESNVFLILSYIVILTLYVLKNNNIFPDLDKYEMLFVNSKRVSWESIKELQNYSISDKYELGWCIFTKTISYIFDDFLSFIFLFSIIYLCLVFFALKKYSNYLLFAIILFILLRFYNSCFVLRQNLAAAVCMASIPFIIKRKPIHFSFCILVAFSFHQSALVFSIMYFLFDVKISKLYIVLLLFASTIMYVGVFTIFSNFLPYFESYQVYATEIRSSEGSNYTSFILSLISLLFILFVYKNKKIDKINRLFIHAMIISSIINFVKIGLPGTVGRLGLYFSYFIILAFPNACMNIENKEMRTLAIVGFSALYFALFYATFNYGFELS